MQPTIAKAGAWSAANCACWFNGAARKTTARGASATIRVDLTGTGDDELVTHLGLVMNRGPDRGKFKVNVDGVLKGTVETYAAKSTPRVVVLF